LWVLLKGDPRLLPETGGEEREGKRGKSAKAFAKEEFGQGV
jgi:hypothetical protein